MISPSRPERRNQKSLGLREVMNEVLKNTGDNRVIAVLAGAAVSLAPPANLPIANDFKRLLAEELVHLDKNPDELANLSSALINRKVPFERLLQLIYDTMADSQPRMVANLLILTYGNGMPNVNHKILTELLSKRRIHLILTTNFDDLFMQARRGIDRVVTESQWDQLARRLCTGTLRRPTIAHLHGSISKASSLVALMQQVGKELQGPRRQVLEYLLENGILVFVGYSGTDEDITPIIQRYPYQRQWWLLKPGDKPDKDYMKQFRPVQLAHKPSNGNQNVLRPLLGHLNQANLQKLSGAVLASAGTNVPALARLAQSLEQQWTRSAALTYATVVMSEQYFHLAERLLENTPAKDWRYWSNWVDSRAFTRRHLGKFDEAAKDFVELRRELETRLTKTKWRDRLVADLILVSEHDIEVSVLIASLKGPKARETILQHCEGLLRKCRLWYENAKQLAPTFELNYYDGEIGLLRGRLEDAREGYRLYEEKGRYWLGDAAVALVASRQAVVEAAAGNFEDAFAKWRKGYQIAKPPMALMVRIQYLFIFPALFVSPIRGYWATQIFAAQLYGLYGRLKFLLLRVRQPEIYHLIRKSLAFSQ